jgi:NADH-quinone oxidoreductase subunit M
MNGFPLITALTLLPLIGGMGVIGLPTDRKQLARRLALGVSLAALALAMVLWTKFNPAFQGGGSGPALQFEERHPWIPALAVEYHVGIDGLGLLMVALSAIVVPMALLASWRLEDRAPLYFGLVLFLEAGLFGTFTALNFIHWFLFWELSLVPAFFLIRLWGGPLRSRAATQFFVYTMAGSIALLLGFLGLFLAAGKFDFIQLSEAWRAGGLAPALAAKSGWPEPAAGRMALAIFAGVFLGFAVKVPLVPFHTWLPGAYAEAPTGTTMLLAGVMSKMGVYGLLRIMMPIFPDQMRQLRTPLLWLAVITILFSASVALAQSDLKRVLAFSSINHLGYCLLGIFAVAGSSPMAVWPATERAAVLDGVFLQMFNHGLTAATLFWFVGLLEERGGGLRGLDDFGGLRTVAPVLCGLMGIALFSSLGLPGLNGFVGEFLIFKGVFALAPWAASLSVLGLLLTAVFILRILHRVFYGPLNPKWSKFSDLSVAERLLALPALGLMFALGLYPQWVLGVINATAVRMVEGFRF